MPVAIDREVVNYTRRRHILGQVLAPIALAGLAFAAVGCGAGDSSENGDGDSSENGDGDSSENGDGDSSENGDGDGSASDAVSVVEAWAREPAEGADRTAVYGIVSNRSDEEITLLAVESPVGSSTELHETLVDDAGTMSMQERQDGIVVLAGGTLDLEPGGVHAMIFDVSAADLGESFEVTFVFDGADDVIVPVTVQLVGDTDTDGDMDMDDDSDMDDGEHPDDADGD